MDVLKSDWGRPPKQAGQAPPGKHTGMIAARRLFVPAAWRSAGRIQKAAVFLTITSVKSSELETDPANAETAARTRPIISSGARALALADSARSEVAPSGRRIRSWV